MCSIEEQPNKKRTTARRNTGRSRKIPSGSALTMWWHAIIWNGSKTHTQKKCKIRIGARYQRLWCKAYLYSSILQRIICPKRRPERKYRVSIRGKTEGLRKSTGYVRPKGRSEGEVPEHARIYPAERNGNIRPRNPHRATLRQDYEPYKAQEDINLLLSVFPHLSERLRIAQLCKGSDRLSIPFVRYYSARPSPVIR